MTPMELGLEIRMATRRDQCLNQDPVLEDKFEVSDMLVDFLQWTFPCYTISQEAFVGTLYGGWHRAKARSACGKWIDPYRLPSQREMGF
jgi:hypothetical protein